MTEYVYFVQNPQNGLVKIGTSGILEDRIMQLRYQERAELKLLGVVNGGRLLEAHIHQLLGEYRIHGEWFHPTEVVLKFIELNCHMPETTLDMPRTTRDRLRREKRDEQLRQVLAHLPKPETISMINKLCDVYNASFQDVLHYIVKQYYDKEMDDRNR